MKNPVFPLFAWTVMCSSACETIQTNTVAPLPVAVNAAVAYTIQGGRDIPLLFDIVAAYNDENGEEVSRTITELPCTLYLQSVPLPFTASIKLQLKPKKDYPEKTVYNTGIGTLIRYATSDFQNKTTSTEYLQQEHTPADAVSSYLKDEAIRTYAKTVHITPRTER